jgi:hypothetical protein
LWTPIERAPVTRLVPSRRLTTALARTSPGWPATHEPRPQPKNARASKTTLADFCNRYELSSTLTNVESPCPKPAEARSGCALKRTGGARRLPGCTRRCSAPASPSSTQPGARRQANSTWGPVPLSRAQAPTPLEAEPGNSGAHRGSPEARRANGRTLVRTRIPSAAGDSGLGYSPRTRAGGGQHALSSHPRLLSPADPGRP